MTASRLSVNVNAIAMLRNRRDLPWPSVTGLAAIAMEAGAKGITVHPRPDERHIRKTDVYELAELIEERYPNKELCLEGYPSADFLKLVEEARPEQVLFVPDDPEQQTSDHGWQFDRDTSTLAAAITAAKNWAVTVSLFCDPDPAAPEHAARLGAERRAGLAVVEAVGALVAVGPAQREVLDAQHAAGAHLDHLDGHGKIVGGERRGRHFQRAASVRAAMTTRG